MVLGIDPCCLFADRLSYSPFGESNRYSRTWSKTRLELSLYSRRTHLFPAADDKMALAVDRFDFLAREVLALFSSFRDGLAVIGACFAAKRTLQLSWNVYRALKVHAVARCFHTDLVKQYGSWAGNRRFHFRVFGFHFAQVLEFLILCRSQ